MANASSRCKLCHTIELVVVLMCALQVCSPSRIGLHASYHVNDRRMRLLTNYDMGVQHIQLTGGLKVDGETKVVSVLTFLKTCKASNGSLVWLLYTYLYTSHALHTKPTHQLQVWHGRAVVYDPLQISVNYPGWMFHVSPPNIIFGTQPQFFLRTSKYSLSRDDDHTIYNFSLPHLYKLDTGHEAMAPPWLLQMTMDNPPEPLDFYFGINDWNYTAYMSQSFMALPEYILPSEVC